MAEPSPLAGRKILLGVSGSIAAYKAAELVRLLKKAGAEVQPLLTPGGARFIPAETLGTLAQREVLTTIFPEGPEEGGGSWTRHVDLGLWADLLVVAPASANTLARLAGGFCGTMLDAVYLSARCPTLVCPAMDHDMMEHPATRENLETLRRHGVRVMEPAHGELASGLIGTGRLPEPAAILDRIIQEVQSLKTAGTPSLSLQGQTVLVTAGPTREPIDPVRFLSNPSTGTMGYALAAEAARRGAAVTLVSGPTVLKTPPGVTRVDVTTADEMHGAALEHADADLVIAAAAVSDYTPAAPSDRKLKKGDDDLTLQLRRTPDVLAALSQRRRNGQTFVGFALETHDGEAHARGKLQRKKLDWIVLNHAGEPGAGFGTGTNRVTLLGADGSQSASDQMSKPDVAAWILDRVVPEEA